MGLLKDEPDVPGTHMALEVLTAGTECRALKLWVRSQRLYVEVASEAESGPE